MTGMTCTPTAHRTTAARPTPRIAHEESLR
jgi:hypothetical protein